VVVELVAQEYHQQTAPVLLERLIQAVVVVVVVVEQLPVVMELLVVQA
jgi:hypothetical protein